MYENENVSYTLFVLSTIDLRNVYKMLRNYVHEQS